MGDVSVQWPVPMDTLGYGHVSKIGHVSTSQRVQWNWPLDTSPTLKYIYISKSIIQYYYPFKCLANEAICNKA